MKVKKSILIKKIYLMLRNSFISSSKNDIFEISGYLSFLTLIAIFPCSIFIAKLAIFLNKFMLNFDFKQDISEIIINFFKNIKDIPLKNLENEIELIFKGPPEMIVWYAFFGLLWTSSSTIHGIRNAFNRAYNMKTKKHYILNRSISIIQFIFISFVTIFILLFLHVFLPFFIKYASYLKNIEQISISYGKLIYFFRYILNIFFLLLYVLCLHIILSEDELLERYKIKNLLPGVILTIVLWIVTSKILQYYITKFIQFNIVYGSLVNIVSILLFFHIIFMCLIFGAEFNYFFNKYKNKEFI